SSDEEITPENDRFSKNGYKAIPPPITGNFLTPRADILFAGLDKYAIGNKIIESQITELNTKTSETTGQTNDVDDEEEGYEMQTVRPETQTVKTRDDKSYCNFHDKKSQEPKLKNIANTGQREGKPVWDNTKRVNHQNFSKYPHLSKTFVPSRVLIRTGFISTARPIISTAMPSVSTARPVCTARPSVSTTRPVCTVRTSIGTTRPIYASRPIYP
ncbi:hypothetical protein Tco_0666799, partial [Tanacetum coccineum]